MPDPLLDGPQNGELKAAIGKWWAVLSPNVKGSLLFIAASVLFTGMIVLIKMASARLHVTEVLFFRQLIMVVLASPVIVAGWPGSVISSRPKLQVLRVFFAFGAMTLGFGALVHLTLAEATVIAFSKSFFMTILAIVFLHEIVAWPRWTALAVGFAGVLIIVWPKDGTALDYWHLAALTSAVCVAVVMVVIRILSREDKPVTILTYQAVGVGLLLLPPTLWFWQMPTLEEWLLIAGIGAISVAAQYINILAIRSAEASALAPLEYTRLVFAAAAGLWFFNEWPTDQVWVGAAIIIAAAFFVVHREQRARSAALDATRRPVTADMMPGAEDQGAAANGKGKRHPDHDVVPRRTPNQRGHRRADSKPEHVGQGE